MQTLEALGASLAWGRCILDKQRARTRTIRVQTREHLQSWEDGSAGREPALQTQGMSWNLQVPCEKVVSTPARGGGILGSHCQPVQPISKFQPQGETLSQNLRWRVIEEDI